MRVTTYSEDVPLPQWPPVVRIDVITTSTIPTTAPPIQLGSATPETLGSLVLQAWNDPGTYLHATANDNEITVTPGKIVMVVDDGTFHRIPKVDGAVVTMVLGSKKGHGAKRATHKRRVTMTKWAKQLEYTLTVAFPQCQYRLFAPTYQPESPINWLRKSINHDLLPTTSTEDDDAEAVYEYISLVLLDSSTLTEEVDPFLCDYEPPASHRTITTDNNDENFTLATVTEAPPSVAGDILSQRQFRVLRVLYQHQEWVFVRGDNDVITTYTINA